MDHISTIIIYHDSTISKILDIIISWYVSIFWYLSSSSSLIKSTFCNITFNKPINVLSQCLISIAMCRIKNITISAFNAPSYRLRRAFKKYCDIAKINLDIIFSTQTCFRGLNRPDPQWMGPPQIVVFRHLARALPQISKNFESWSTL